MEEVAATDNTDVWQWVLSNKEKVQSIEIYMHRYPPTALLNVNPEGHSLNWNIIFNFSEKCIYCIMK
jgi:hypothetical protein